ncbi:MAG: zinc ribbon domain-containing protein [Sulfuritalea sp.]|nr:zinc ribbon domain-containing protein [Sulfuritalea sp.]
MLATKCSFCQHENLPGSRFCMKCGSPMHLKVCPNPQCGKVSDVTAEVCESCGQAFPKIALAPVRAEAPAESKQPATPPATAVAGKSRMPAWPLVMMAIVAGGLPLLWANRAQLPTPKTWQIEPDASKSRATTPPAGPAQKPPAAASNVAPPSAPTSVEAAAPSNIEPGQVANAGAAEDSRNQARQPANGKAPKKTTKKPRKKDEPPRPCTEAVAALGLCDPKQVEK